MKVSKKDLKGEIEYFPIEVVSKMVNRQVEQGNTPNVKVFQINPSASFYKGGFAWDMTVEGYDFWFKVIVHDMFDMFFKKYPEKAVVSDEMDSNPTNTKLEVTMEQIAEKFGVSVEDLVIKN